MEILVNIGSGNGLAPILTSVNWTQRNKPRRNLSQDMKISFQESAVKMSAILFRAPVLNSK